MSAYVTHPMPESRKTLPRKQFYLLFFAVSLYISANGGDMEEGVKERFLLLLYFLYFSLFLFPLTFALFPLIAHSLLFSLFCHTHTHTHTHMQSLDLSHNRATSLPPTLHLTSARSVSILGTIYFTLASLLFPHTHRLTLVCEKCCCGRHQSARYLHRGKRQ